MAAKKTEDAKPVVEAPKGTRPVDLAKTLGINPKSLRSYLRRAFPRGEDTFGTTWYLTDDQVKSTTEHFTAEPETDEVEA